MNERAEYLLQILEKIGSPLMAAILAAPGRKGPAESAQQDAVRMAELLGKTTQASIEMSKSMDFGIATDRGDSLRVALAALAGGLVGEYYRQSGKTPGDGDIRKITAALQAVLAYSDNFTPSPETTQRLKNLGPAGASLDAHQAVLQYVQAFVPVVNAINAFPFGQPEQKLIMDVSARLVQRAAELREAVLGGLPEDDEKRAELGILAALAQIYGACHESETARLMAMSEEQRAGAGLGLESVWKMFELRAAMLETLGGSMAPAAGKSTGGGSKSPAPLPYQPPPAPPPQQQQGGATPLSMFAKKPDSGAATPPAPPASPPTPPPAPPPGGTGPMSFFKSPTKKDDE